MYLTRAYSKRMCLCLAPRVKIKRNSGKKYKNSCTHNFTAFNIFLCAVILMETFVRSTRKMLAKVIIIWQSLTRWSDTQKATSEAFPTGNMNVKCTNGRKDGMVAAPKLPNPAQDHGGLLGPYCVLGLQDQKSGTLSAHYRASWITFLLNSSLRSDLRNETEAM